jgi:hypothetical protein
LKWLWCRCRRKGAFVLFNSGAYRCQAQSLPSQAIKAPTTSLPLS